MRRFRPIAVALVAAAAFAPGASAHAYPIGSSPSFGEALRSAPPDVRITFTDSVRAAPAIDSSNSRVLVLPLARGLGRGAYTARWRVISNDGHTVEGLLSFRVGPGGPATTPALPLLGTSVGWTNLIGRWVFLLGTLLALGAAGFVGLVWLPAIRAAGLVPAEGDAVARDEVRATSIVLSLSFLAVQAGCVLAILHATTGTRYGRAHELAILFAGVGLAATASPRPVFRVLTGIAALGVATTASLSGHALDPGRPQPWSLGADLFHIWSAALWLGGLLELVLALRAVRELPDSSGRRVTAWLVRRFSFVALLCVAVVAITGVCRALVELTAVSQLWNLAYGRTILVKTGLLVLLVAVGWSNRSQIVTRLDVAASAVLVRRLRAQIFVEIGLLTAIVAAVALLTDVRPGAGVSLTKSRRARTSYVESSTTGSDAENPTRLPPRRDHAFGGRLIDRFSASPRGP
jgi:copper transport protein